jgi:hypothetical protein
LGVKDLGIGFRIQGSEFGHLGLMEHRRGVLRHEPFALIPYHV